MIIAAFDSISGLLPAKQKYCKNDANRKCFIKNAVNAVADGNNTASDTFWARFADAKLTRHVGRVLMFGTIPGGGKFLQHTMARNNNGKMTGVRLA